MELVDVYHCVEQKRILMMKELLEYGDSSVHQGQLYELSIIFDGNGSQGRSSASDDLTKFLPKWQNFTICPFIQFIMIMDSLKHIPIANAPAQGPTSSILMLPRAILDVFLDTSCTHMGVKCNGYVSGFTNQGK